MATVSTPEPTMTSVPASEATNITTTDSRPSSPASVLDSIKMDASTKSASSSPSSILDKIRTASPFTKGLLQVFAGTGDDSTVTSSECPSAVGDDGTVESELTGATGLTTKANDKSYASENDNRDTNLTLNNQVMNLSMEVDSIENSALSIKGYSVNVKPDEADHIFMKVRGCTITPSDVMKCSGIGLTKEMLPYVPGQVVVGTIEVVGSKANSYFKTGDRVIGMVESGGCQRFLSAKADNFVSVPPKMSNTTALSLMNDWMPAYKALRVAKNYLKGANLFERKVLITNAISPIGQAAIHLANKEGANIYCCAEVSHHEYLQTLSPRIKCLELQPEKWGSEMTDSIDVVIDNACVDGYSSSWDAIAYKGVLIALPSDMYDDTKLFGVFDVEDIRRKLHFKKAKFFMYRTIALDMEEEYKLDTTWEKSTGIVDKLKNHLFSGKEGRAMYMQDFQHLAFMHEEGQINIKAGERITLQDGWVLDSAQKLFKRERTSVQEGTFVCFPWKLSDQ